MSDQEFANSARAKRQTAAQSIDGKEELSAYLEYNKILRSWSVAFGVGGPALFLINEDSTYEKKRRFKFCRWLVHQFWIGVALDLATIAAYGVAIWQLFTVFGSGS